MSINRIINKIIVKSKIPFSIINGNHYLSSSDSKPAKIFLGFETTDCIGMIPKDASAIRNTLEMLSDKQRDFLMNFTEELSCFINVKFYNTKVSSSSCNYYKIEVCNAGSIMETYGFEALQATKPQKINGKQMICSSVNLFDIKELKMSIHYGIPESNDSLIKHEFLHSLGLDHIKIVKDIRSIMEDIYDSREYKECLKKYVNNVKLAFKCYNLPVDITPIDLQGLLQIWGHSYDNSERCVGVRQKFIDKYSKYIDVMNELVTDSGEINGDSLVDL